MDTPLGLGKKPATSDRRDFKLTELALSLPPMPTRPFGSGRLYSDWGMLGNDRYGDCVWAGGDHETMMYNKFAGRTITFTSDNALSDYASTGFDPSTGANDNGTDVRQSMGYRRSTGLIDSKGNRHKIDAYASIDPGNFDLMVRAVFTFGAVGIGFEVPNSIWGQWDAGEVWDVVSNDGGIDGGHYVPIVGFPAPDQATFVTWGKRTVMTRKFYEKYNDEAWVPLSKEAMKASGFNIRHIDWSKLNDMLSSL